MGWDSWDGHWLGWALVGMGWKLSWKRKGRKRGIYLENPRAPMEGVNPGDPPQPFPAGFQPLPRGFCNTCCKTRKSFRELRNRFCSSGDVLVWDLLEVWEVFLSLKTPKTHLEAEIHWNQWVFSINMVGFQKILSFPEKKKDFLFQSLKLAFPESGLIPIVWFSPKTFMTFLELHWAIPHFWKHFQDFLILFPLYPYFIPPFPFILFPFFLYFIPLCSLFYSSFSLFYPFFSLFYSSFSLFHSPLFPYFIPFFFLFYSPFFLILFLFFLYFIPPFSLLFPPCLSKIPSRFQELQDIQLENFGIQGVFCSQKLLWKTPERQNHPAPDPTAPTWFKGKKKKKSHFI